MAWEQEFLNFNSGEGKEEDIEFGAGMNSKHNGDAMPSIVGMSYYAGELRITADEKVKTIDGIIGEEAAAKEASKVKKGLGIISNSVANVGETPITAAAIAAVKFAVTYNISLSDVKDVVISTESPNDGSKNNGVSVVNAVNMISRVLKDNAGIDVGNLSRIESLFHNQSACVGGVAWISYLAKNKTCSTTLLITTDDAKYKLGSVADETGGFGATATLIKSDTSGLILLPYTGRSQSDVVDFFKPISVPDDETTGMASISKYPIVFGQYSRFVYMGQTYKAGREALRKENESFDSTKFFDDYVIILHVPYSELVRKTIGNFVTHFMRIDGSLKERILSEINSNPKATEKYVDIPRLEGFDSQEKEFGLIEEVGDVVLRLEAEKELVLRGDVHKEEEISKNSREIAEIKQNRLLEIMGKYGIKEGRLASAFNKTIDNLETMKLKGGTLDQLIDAFSPLYTNQDMRKKKGHLNEFEDVISNFNSAVRSTKTYKELYTKLGTEYSLTVPSSIANIYTGSSFLALASYVANADEEMLRRKKILFMGYGSGAESFSTVIQPKDALRMRDILRNADLFEKESVTYIDANQYNSIRKKELDSLRIKEPMLKEVGRELKINEPRLVEYFTRLKEHMRKGSEIQTESQKSTVKTR